MLTPGEKQDNYTDMQKDFAFSALALLTRRQERHPVYTNQCVVYVDVTGALHILRVQSS